MRQKLPKLKRYFPAFYFWTSSLKGIANKQGEKGKGFPYALPSTGPGESAHSHPPGSRLTILSASPAVTFPAAERHCPLAGTKLYCLVTEAHRCEQLAQGCETALSRVGFEPTTC